MAGNFSQGLLQRAYQESFEKGYQIGFEKGYQIGIQKEHIITIKTLLTKGKSTEQIADLLDMDISYVKHVEELLKEYPDKSEKELVELL